MGIFDRFPYSSTHEMNLDYMLGKATEIAEDMQQVTAGMEQVQAGLSAISEKTEQATQAAAAAAQSASSIEGSVTAAEEAAEEAQMHNESAQTWANNAMTYKADCQRAASEAAASSTSAAQAATAAAASEDTVATYAQAANASAQSAANNNDSAHQYANQANASATNAMLHSSNAQTAATNAQTAATNAETSATNANTSATNAAASADRAATLKTNVETLHRMCATAVDLAAEQAVAAANSAAQAAATKTDVENLVESLPEDFTALNNTVNQLSDEIDAVVTSEEVWGEPVTDTDITRIPDKNFTSTNNIQDNTGWSILYWQAAENGKYRIIFNKNQAQNRVNVYSSVDFSSATYVKRASAVSNVEKIVDVVAGQYIVAQAWYPDYLITIQKQDRTEYDIPSIDEKITAEENNIFRDGWRTFPVDDFAVNDWSSYNSTTSRTNRVRYTKPIEYPYPVTLMAAPDFYIDGIYSDAHTNSARTSIDLSANTPIKISIRRINEITENANVAEFASAFSVSTPLAGIEKYKLTFTDISMFERVGCCGDSYTAGGGYISGVTGLTWGKNLERQAGITVDIYAKSGESIHSANGWNYDTDNGLPKLLNSAECGLYWMAHGINSAGSDTAIGTPADMEADPKPYTFYGQYVYAINAIKSKFPRARIVIQTITGTSYSLWETTYKKINTAIRNIAQFCNIPLIELIDDDFYKSRWYENHSLSNHPTAMLASGMAMANRRLLSKSILDNPDYFIDFGNKYKTAISCPLVIGGSISASPNIAANGTTVTLSNTANSGYHFVRYESDDITIEADGTFVIPGSTNAPGHGTYTIYGVFEPDT